MIVHYFHKITYSTSKNFATEKFFSTVGTSEEDLHCLLWLDIKFLF